MTLHDHPIVGDLRIVRELHGQQLAAVEALCRRPHPVGQDGKPRLPTDEEIGAELGVSASTVRGYLDKVADKIDGLEALDRRARIYTWYWHRQWEQANAAGAETDGR